MGARARFDRWVSWSKLSDADVARRIGCDVSLPGKLRKTDRTPSLAIAHAIERVTSEPDHDGAVWDEPPIATQEWLEEAQHAKPSAA